MKLGILTFHSQLNYGGVLQCWALKTALGQMGHEAVVVDRWLDDKNSRLKREFATLTARGWVKLLVRGLFGCGDFGKLMRTIRTIRFVRGLGLTKFHFCDWSELKHANTSVLKQFDFLIVGSDQVWHCGDWGDPQPYLLEGAPKIRAISYAASFGLKSLPPDMVDLYKRGLARFSAISCREREGAEICRALGFAATHVVDPTLLLELDKWSRLLQSTNQKIKQQPNNRVLVCYFMSADVASALPLLEDFSGRMKCTVKVLSDNQPMLRPVPKSARVLIENFRHSRVKICRGYGPKEFVQAFASATWTLTDSFHAVMFSSIFNCNARFLRPSSAMRAAMFARIEEFASKYASGPFFASDVASALSSLEHGEMVTFDAVQIAARRSDSMKWLNEAIKG